MSFRVRPEVKAAMDRAAHASGRSVAQEIETRIESSVVCQALLTPALQLAYGREAAALLLVLMREMVRQGRVGAFLSGGQTFESMENWLADPYGYDQAVRAVNAILEAFRPEGDRAALRKSRTRPQDAATFAERSARAAKVTLAAVKDPHWGEQFPDDQRNLDLEELGAEVRRLAPRLVERLQLADGKKIKS